MESVESLPRVACDWGFCLLGLHIAVPNRFDQAVWKVWFLAFTDFNLQKMSRLISGNLSLL